MEAPRTGGHAKLQASSHIEEIAHLVSKSRNCISHTLLGSTPVELLRADVPGSGKVRQDANSRMCLICKNPNYFW